MEVGTSQCGSGANQTVNITPRRLQHFVVKANTNYHWENWQLSYDAKDSIIASGTVKSDGNGILTVTGFENQSGWEPSGDLSLGLNFPGRTGTLEHPLCRLHDRRIDHFPVQGESAFASLLVRLGSVDYTLRLSNGSV